MVYGSNLFFFLIAQTEDPWFFVLQLKFTSVFNVNEIDGSPIR